MTLKPDGMMVHLKNKLTTMKNQMHHKSKKDKKKTSYHVSCINISIPFSNNYPTIPDNPSIISLY